MTAGLDVDVDGSPGARMVARAFEGVVTVG